MCTTYKQENRKKQPASNNGNGVRNVCVPNNWHRAQCSPAKSPTKKKTNHYRSLSLISGRDRKVLLIISGVSRMKPVIILVWHRKNYYINIKMCLVNLVNKRLYMSPTAHTSTLLGIQVVLEKIPAGQVQIHVSLQYTNVQYRIIIRLFIILFLYSYLLLNFVELGWLIDCAVTFIYMWGRPLRSCTKVHCTST